MKAKHFLLMIVAVCIISIAAKGPVIADSILGRWKYLISDVPPEYESGFFTFEQKDNKTTGYVGEAEKQEIKELAVTQGKVSFITEGQGGVFKYSFEQKGDTLTGIVSSQYGDFPIKAIKEPGK
jgi:hypothetical protein